MTDRALTLTVMLSNPTRTDDLDPLIAAIAQMRGVEQVVAGTLNNVEHELAYLRAHRDIRGRLWDALEHDPTVRAAGAGRKG